MHFLYSLLIVLLYKNVYKKGKSQSVGSPLFLSAGHHRARQRLFKRKTPPRRRTFCLPTPSCCRYPAVVIPPYVLCTTQTTQRVCRAWGTLAKRLDAAGLPAPVKGIRNYLLSSEDFPSLIISSPSAFSSPFLGTF